MLLRDLREHGVMPAAFEAEHPVVCKVIRWLLAPNPAERPTAVEVLRSELLPPQVRAGKGVLTAGSLAGRGCGPGALVGLGNHWLPVRLPCPPAWTPCHPPTPHPAPPRLPPPAALQVLDEQLTDLLRCLPDNPAMHEKVLDAVFSLSRGAASPAAAALEAPGAPMPVQVGVQWACWQAELLCGCAGSRMRHCSEQQLAGVCLGQSTTCQPATSRRPNFCGMLQLCAAPPARS